MEDEDSRRKEKSVEIKEEGPLIDFAIQEDSIPPPNTDDYLAQNGISAQMSPKPFIIAPPPPPQRGVVPSQSEVQSLVNTQNSVMEQFKFSIINPTTSNNLILSYSTQKVAPIIQVPPINETKYEILKRGFVNSKLLSMIKTSFDDQENLIE